VADGAPPIGTGEIVTSILIAVLVALMVFLYKYLRKVEHENRRLEELIMRRDEEWKQYWDQKYGQSYQQWYPQESAAPQPQSPYTQIPYYEEEVEKSQRSAPSAATPTTPYPLATDGFFRVIPCPICEVENKVRRPLYILGKDPNDGSYILSCGHTDGQGRLHMLKVVDIRKAYAPIVELEAAKEAVAAATVTPSPTAKKEKKKRGEDVQEEE